jgi:hypothetical protein
VQVTGSPTVVENLIVDTIDDINLKDLNKVAVRISHYGVVHGLKTFTRGISAGKLTFDGKSLAGVFSTKKTAH